MTRKDFNRLIEAVKIVEAEGFEGLEEAVSILLNEAMKIERNRVLQADPYERTEERTGYANGYKPKQLKSRLGKLDVLVPQVRGDVSFYPSVLEKGLRSERAVKVAMAEMYIQGVSTRKVKKVFEKMCGLDVTSSEVSRASALLDEELEKWRTRPLGEFPYVQFDARYDSVRIDGSVVQAATLIGVGIAPSGKRTVLGVSTSISEAETHWRGFFESLKQRGIHGIRMITSDDCSGLRKALKTVFGGIPWTRCHVHLQRNAFSHVLRKHMQEEVAQKIRGILSAPDREEAERLLEKTVRYYEQKSPKIAAWMEENIPDGFAVFSLPHKVRRKLRSTNLLERLNREIKRRTRVCTLFPNELSLLRLTSAVLMEISEEWEADRRYIVFEGE